MRAILAAALLLARVAFAQTSDEDLRQKVLSFRYPLLARAAAVQGEVRFKVASNGAASASGPPLLVQAAIDNAKPLGLNQSVNLNYHFVLSRITTEPDSFNVKRGDAFDRFFLRMFGLKTEKVVPYNKCMNGVDQPDDVRISEDTIDIWVNAGAMCAIVD